MLELELKAAVPDPAAVRAALRDAGAEVRFRGLLVDRRFDRDGELLAKDQVLRVRRWEPTDGAAREELTWKGPTSTRDGYKAREEIECQLAGGAPADRLLTSLGYREMYRIDRHVELFAFEDGVARLEWYPRLDTLIEIEGEPEAIERIAWVTTLPRESFSSDPLDAFVAAYRERTGHDARVALRPGEEPAHWP